MCVLLLMIASAYEVAIAGTAPQIVKRIELRHQTGGIGPVTLYTPKHRGLFRLSTFMVTTVNNGNSGQLCDSFGFTDYVGEGTSTGPSVCLNTETKGNISEEITVVDSVAGKSITLTVTAIGDVTDAYYDVNIIVEEL